MQLKIKNVKLKMNLKNFRTKNKDFTCNTILTQLTGVAEEISFLEGETFGESAGVSLSQRIFFLEAA